MSYILAGIVNNNKLPTKDNSTVCSRRFVSAPRRFHWNKILCSSGWTSAVSSISFSLCRQTVSATSELIVFVTWLPFVYRCLLLVRFYHNGQKLRTGSWSLSQPLESELHPKHVSRCCSATTKGQNWPKNQTSTFTPQDDIMFQVSATVSCFGTAAGSQILWNQGKNKTQLQNLGVNWRMAPKLMHEAKCDRCIVTHLSHAAVCRHLKAADRIWRNPVISFVFIRSSSSPA